MMPISFANIPSDIRVPLYWVEVDPSMAGLPMIHLRSLLVGTMLPSGTAVPNIPVIIGTQAQVDQKFGIGSELSRMFKAFFANNFANEVWAGPVAEPAGSPAAAQGAIVVTAPPEQPGTIHLYIGGQHVAVNHGIDTIQQIAQEIHDAIMAVGAYAGLLDDLPVSAAVTSPATGNGSAVSFGVNLRVQSVTPGTDPGIDVGDLISGTGIPSGTLVTAQLTGTPGQAGDYTCSQDMTSAVTNFDLNLTATGQVTAATAATTITVTGVTAAGGTIQNGGSILAATGSAPPTGIPVGTTIVNQVSGNPQGDGVYTISHATTAAITTAVTAKFGVTAQGVGISWGQGLTVTAATGTIAIGAQVTGTGIPPLDPTFVMAQTSGTPGGNGNYIISNDADCGPAASPVPVVFTAGANAVILTCNWKGVSGNDIRVDLNYYGKIGGEELAPGLQIALPPTNFLRLGSGTPDFTQLITNMGETEFEYVAMPYTDATSLNAWEVEYGFSDNGRWGWKRQHFGHVFSSRRGAFSDLIAFGNSRNSGVVSVMAWEETVPTPVYELAAAYTAKAQRSLSNDPARPLQTLQLLNCLPAPFHEQFNWLEINDLAWNGLAIQKVWPGSGFPQIAREQTTYQLNLYGYSDDAYELVTTLATLALLIRNQRYNITTKFPRHKLADDGTRFGPGQAIVTPGILKAELVSEYYIDEYNGLVENAAKFVQNLIVERDPNNPNRVNVLYPPDLINQLRIFAVLAQFRLQYDRGVDAEIIGTGAQFFSGSNQASTLPPLSFG
jgi:phage tail sheath gpL-like